MKSGIYSITNTANGKRYVGSAVNLKQRWAAHRHYLRRGDHHCRHLQAAWNKYGEESFLFEVLEECEITQLIEREQWWLDCAQPEYNICRVAGSSLGVRHTEETRRHNSEAQKLRGPTTEEARRHNSEGHKGIRRTAEQRIRLSEFHKGMKHTDESRRKMSEAKKGKPSSFSGKHHTDDTRLKISEAKSGKQWSAARRLAEDKRLAKSEA